MAILTGMVIILMLTALGAVSGARLGDVDIPLVDLGFAVLMTLPFGMWLLGFGLYCSTVFHSRLIASLVTTVVVVFSYIFNSSTEFVSVLTAYNRFVPFNYYAWGQPLTAPVNWESAIILVIAGVVFYGLGLVAFNRRDVTG